MESRVPVLHSSDHVCLLTDNPPVEEMEVWPHEGQLMVEWKTPRGRLPSEYVVEWLSDDSLDWRRASKSSKHMLTGTCILHLHAPPTCTLLKHRDLYRL